MGVATIESFDYGYIILFEDGHIEEFIKDPDLLARETQEWAEDVIARIE